MPAARSSTMIPRPPCSRSSWRTGGGLRISKNRNRTNASATWPMSEGASSIAVSCPATSSITTWPGSCLPLSFSTIDAAGTPTIVTTASAMSVPMVRAVALGCEPRAAKYQMTAVAPAAQVPGPPGRSPMSRNVPVSHAHAVLERAGFALVVVIVVFRAPVFLAQALQNFRVENGRGDSVFAAGPLAEVDQTAAVATEGKVLVFFRDQRAAGGAAQSFIGGHGSSLPASDHAGDHIVV